MDGPAASRQDGPLRGVAERLRRAAREEFSLRGYHGARVQSIARGASCNVAIMYRHWTSKQALYLDVLRDAWRSTSAEIARLVEGGAGGGDAMAGYVDALLRDPVGAQILAREYLDGAPFLARLVAAEPALAETVRRCARTLRGPGGGLDPTLVVLAAGALAALFNSSRDAIRPLLGEPIAPDAVRGLVLGLLHDGAGEAREPRR
jgi:TetR/AcrR family transcriptional regulator